MLTASAIRNMAQHGVTDTEYIMATVQCKIIQAAFEGDSEVWLCFYIPCFKNKYSLKKVADDVVRILMESGFEAEYEKFADVEYEKYLRFKISWEG